MNIEALKKLLAEKEKYQETVRTELIAVTGQVQLLKQLIDEAAEGK